MLAAVPAGSESEAGRADGADLGRGRQAAEFHQRDAHDGACERLGVPAGRARRERERSGVVWALGRSSRGPSTVPLADLRILRTDFIPGLSQASVATGRPGYPTLK